VAANQLGRIIPGTRTMLNEKFELQEGAWKGFHMPLRNQASVAVSAEMEGKPVDVMWVDSDNWGALNRGGQFQEITALSEANTMRMNRNATIGPGDWYVVARRNREAILFKHPSVVSLTVQETQ
jgi:hypothetical protein